MIGQHAVRRFLFGGAILTGAAVVGCDTSRPAPGPLPAAAPVEATSIVALLPNSGIAELDVWENTLRRYAAQSRAILEIKRLESGAPASVQNDAVRQAIGDGTSGLLIVAKDPAALAPTLVEARDADLPIVLVDREVPMPGKPLPIVVYEPESESAHKLVAAALEDAAKLRDFSKFLGVIVVLEGGDDHAQARVAAMRAELEEAGVPMLPDVPIQVNSAIPTVARLLLMNPQIAILLADEDTGLRAAAEYRHDKLDHTQNRFVFGGYVTDPVTMELASKNFAAGIIDRNIPAAITRGHDAVLALTRGETIPDRIVIPTPLVRSNGPEVEGVAPGFLYKPQLNAGASP